MSKMRIFQFVPIGYIGFAAAGLLQSRIDDVLPISLSNEHWNVD